ncbi:hypothetical protein HLB23_08245 [Nocardia uniformis]|uniref:Uncharacterized protein n=1 Tax=Nocardia uniformis TaxID=53432 RepID=A0A849C0I1_9NOCA|nr:hypothetical protein [Nocardia uniformis]NNH69855.1 hypothetical protein [Nocardia uniformis]
MPLPDQPTWIEYAEFGERFVEAAVTESRIEAAVSGMAGRGMTIGPFSVGPAGLARFIAKGSVGKPRITRRGPHVHFEVMVPVSLRVDITLGGQRLRLEALVEIDLDLHARTAAPLLIVIDIPPVTGRDVSFVMRAQAIGNAFELLIDPIARMVQREVANRLNVILADPDSRSGRIFDVEAIIDGRQSRHRVQTEFEWIGYDEFGHRFFERIVTADRVREVVESMAGQPIEVGPLRTGPGNAAEVTVQGSIRVPRVSERNGETAEMAFGTADLVAFDLAIPVSLDITVDVLKANRYRAEVLVPLELIARAADPLLIVIDTAAPSVEDIELEVIAEGWRARTLGKLAKINEQVAAQVAAVVRGEVADTSRRTIDVAARLNSIGA